MMKYCLLFFCLFALHACQRTDPMQKLGKLQGTWMSDDGEGGLYETWKSGKGGVLHGVSYKINGSDSIIYERVELKKDSGRAWYIVTATDGTAPVRFGLIGSDDRGFIFENKQHDFPQRIIYRFVNDDSIAARIEGDQKGVTRYVDYYFSRAE